MKQLLAATFLIIAAVAPAAADDDRLGKDWIPMPEVMLRVYALGFTEISEIEAEDGVWKAKGTKDGVYTKVQLDPHTGEVIAPRPKHRRHKG